MGLFNAEISISHQLHEPASISLIAKDLPNVLLILFFSSVPNSSNVFSEEIDPGNISRS
ncbi:MAG: hypothetical protein ACW9W3_07315 [Candidatus Nitrosopumilus sp. bin_68KS]